MLSVFKDQNGQWFLAEWINGFYRQYAGFSVHFRRFRFGLSSEGMLTGDANKGRTMHQLDLVRPYLDALSRFAVALEVKFQGRSVALSDPVFLDRLDVLPVQQARIVEALQESLGVARRPYEPL